MRMVWVVVTLIVFVLIVALPWGTRGAPAEAQSVEASFEVPEVPAFNAEMDSDQRRDWFWEIIELTKQGAMPDYEQDERLSIILNEYSASEIEIFQAEFDSVHDGSYSWDLWGAAYVMMGGCGDDGFDYFRTWMVANGREFFEAAERSPDKMAQLIPSDYAGLPAHEDLAYVAMNLWANKAGKDFADMPRTTSSAYTDGPSGVPFEEVEKALAARYPLLWARFGKAPLG